MAQFQPLPQHVHHSTTRLTHRNAHNMLSTFLAEAENNAAYRPDSTLSERGPISSSTSSATNLTLHHLRRILQGMEGKRVGGSEYLDGFLDGTGEETKKRKNGAEYTDGGKDASSRKRQQQQQQKMDGTAQGYLEQDVETDLEPPTPAGSQGWQDKELFDQAQRNDHVDAMNQDRNPTSILDQPANEMEAREMMEVEVEETGEKVDSRHIDDEQGQLQETQDYSATTGLSKEERKQRKKARRLDEKRKANAAHRS